MLYKSRLVFMFATLSLFGFVFKFGLIWYDLAFCHPPYGFARPDNQPTMETILKPFKALAKPRYNSEIGELKSLIKENHIAAQNTLSKTNIIQAFQSIGNCYDN